jgi:hypothetical protein
MQTIFENNYSMKKLNLLKKYPHYYSSTKTPELIEIEKAKFISVRAKGSFTDKIFYDRIEGLIHTADAVKELFENSDQAFDVSVLEGLYWYDEKKHGKIGISNIYDTFPFSLRTLSQLEYRLMIRMPEYITSKDILKAKKAVATVYKAIAAKAEFFELNEGKCAQMLHLGPFANEKETLSEIETFVEKKHLIKNGLHHEIYLVDFTKVKSQEGLRTILREPVK